MVSKLRHNIAKVGLVGKKKLKSRQPESSSSINSLSSPTSSISSVSSNLELARIEALDRECDPFISLTYQGELKARVAVHRIQGLFRTRKEMRRLRSRLRSVYDKVSGENVFE